MEKLNRIGEVAEKRKITAYRIAEDTGITYALVSAYIKNTKQPTLKQLKRIADYLEVKGKELLNF